MAEIFPFRAATYSLKGIPDLSGVVTQPYDKITPEMQDRCYERDPHNLIRILLGRGEPEDNEEENVYTRAGKTFQRWVHEEILVSQRQPALYPYFQQYQPPDRPGLRKMRKGFIGLTKLEEYSMGIVHRHEETHSGPKQDRLELLKSTRAHFGQLLVLYPDPAGEIERILDAATDHPAWMQVTDDFGVLHRVWRSRREQEILDIIAKMKDKPLVIADGHHRYETALAYRRLRQEQEAEDSRADFVMMTFVRMESSGLTILPTHRLLHGLDSFHWKQFQKKAAELFELEEVDLSSEESGGGFRARLGDAGAERPTLGVAAAGAAGGLLMRLRRDIDVAKLLPDCPAGQRNLDVVILHRLVMERMLGITREAVQKQTNIRYVREWDQGVQAVSSGEAQLCFFLNPPSIEKMTENALADLPLPQKWTDFYPKLLSGLAIYWMDNPLGL